MGAKAIRNFPSISGRLIGLLHAWVEWRSCQGQPRGVRLPDETYVHRLRFSNAGVVAERVAAGYCMERGTAPRPDVWQVEFSQAFMALDSDQRAWLLILVGMQDQPWMRGPRWRAVLRELEIKPRHFVRLAGDALMSLSRNARARGLIGG